MCSNVGNVPVYETVSLQDTVKTYMLSSNYPHQISLDEIERVCKLLIMRIKVSTPPTNNASSLPPVRNCRVLVKQLDTQDLLLWQKPPTLDEELDPNSLLDLNESQNPTNNSPKRYPTRHERVKSYIPTLEDRDSDNWPSPPAKTRKISYGPSDTRIAARAHGRTQSAETSYAFNITTKAVESPVSASHENLHLLSEIDDDDLPKINLEGPQYTVSTSPAKTRMTTNTTVTASPTLSPPVAPVQQTPTTLTTLASPVSAKKKKTKTPKEPSTKKGTLNIKLHARGKPKSTRKFTCKFCPQEEYSQAAMNAHHIETHDDVGCTKRQKRLYLVSCLLSLSCLY